ncbi:Malectin [Amphibalanus amphitrite]|uniref:Malectin n=1 Tax=Amphibalanus amphitrite TaxID=1232801 RepID=A0A6A4W9L3_AMPAM|nr:Malectin [Amphibalanus amphitrite]
MLKGKEFLSDFVEESSDHGIRLFYMKVEESRWVQPTEGSDKSPIDGGCYAKSHYLHVPLLPPLPDLASAQPPEEEAAAAEDPAPPRPSKASSRPSGPRTPDPYSSDETSTMLPLFVAIGAFIPVLLCLCKL